MTPVPNLPPKGVAGRQRGPVGWSLAFLGVNALGLGLWSTIAPRSWFDTFPGAGHHWVRPDGPYNHHLASDVGALSLALAVVTLAALVVRSAVMARVAGAAWLVSGLPHLMYHLGHREKLPRVDQVASLGGLVSEVLLAAFCVAAARSWVPGVAEPTPTLATGPLTGAGRRVGSDVLGDDGAGRHAQSRP